MDLGVLGEAPEDLELALARDALEDGVLHLIDEVDEPLMLDVDLVDPHAEGGVPFHELTHR